MNLLLLEPQDVDGEGRTIIRGRRSKHIQEILHAEPRDIFRAGVLGGKIGDAHVLRIHEGEVHLKFSARGEPPPPSLVTLVLALPRPKVLKRVIANISSLGVKKIILLNAFRVEKPYWSSEQIKLEAIHEACLMGLEQACDTILPEIQLERRFKPFVEDRLPSLIANQRSFFAHPGVGTIAPFAVPEPFVLIVGPEGGFIDYEVKLLQAAGITPVHLGERILKVETAIPYLLGRMLEI